VLFLVPSKGKEGAALATMASSILLVALTMRSSQKLYRIPYDYAVPIFTFLGYLLASIFFFQEFFSSSITFFILKVVLCVGMLLFSLYYTRKTFSLT
jgi:O-antigen/teichoic acid export membrane protein